MRGNHRADPKPIEQGGNRGEVLYHQASEIPRWDGQGTDRGI